MSFISTYLDFTQHQEATERVHRWVAISVIAGAMERRVWLGRGSYTLFPNLYIFIVGPSGVVRKSTSTALGVNMLRDLNDFKIMSDRLTAATLIDQLSRSKKTFNFAGREIKQSATYAYGSELIVFLGEVFGSISELLTTFYDCTPYDSSKPWIYETKANGITQIYGPCLNILGATTPTWLVRGIPPSEMEGGFASRVIFVVEDSARHAIAWPDAQSKPEDQEAKLRFLMSDLRRIYELSGAFRVTDALRVEGQRWYESHQKSLKSNTDLRFSGYYGRKFDTVLKVAMALSVSDDSSLILDVDDFHGALALLTDVEERMFNAFGSHGNNTRSGMTETIWRILCEAGKKGARLSQICARVRRDANHELVSDIIQDLRVMHRAEQSADLHLRDMIIFAIEPEKPL